jgi:histidyl-tRNA synthetase
VVAVGGAGPEEAVAFAEELRQAGVAATAELVGRSPGAAMKRADRAGARWAALLGDEELAAGEVTVKDLRGGGQERLARAVGIERLRQAAVGETVDGGAAAEAREER